MWYVRLNIDEIVFKLLKFKYEFYAQQFYKHMLQKSIL